MKMMNQLASVSMLIAMMLILTGFQSSNDCNPCNFKLNYKDLEKIRIEEELYYVKKSNKEIKHGPYIMFNYDDENTIIKCGCFKEGLETGKWIEWHYNGKKRLREFTKMDNKTEYGLNGMIMVRRNPKVNTNSLKLIFGGITMKMELVIKE